MVRDSKLAILQSAAGTFSLVMAPEQARLDDELTSAIDAIARKAAAAGSLASGNTLSAVANEAAKSLDRRANFAFDAFKRSCDAYGICLSSKLSDYAMSVLDRFIREERDKIESALRRSAAFRSVSSPAAHEATLKIVDQRAAMVRLSIKAEVTLAAVAGDRDMRS